MMVPLFESERLLRAPEIQTSRLLLRPLEASDAEPLFSIFSDTEAIRYWGTPDRTLEDSKNSIVRFQESWKKNGFGDWAVTENSSGRFIGFCGLHYITGMDEVNLGYLLNRSYWGKGYATEACFASLNFGFEKRGLSQVVATTDPKNGASLRLLEKCCMTLSKNIVRNGRDRVVYQITKTEWDKMPK